MGYVLVNGTATLQFQLKSPSIIPVSNGFPVIRIASIPMKPDAVRGSISSRIWFVR